MQDLVELQAKLVRSQADIEKGLGHLVNQRAFIADKLVAGEDVTRPYELLETLEETQRLHVQHRDRLRRELDWTLAGKNRRWTI